MKAVVYGGPHKVSVKNVPDAKIEKPTDVLVKITTTNICGSDLHMYDGRTTVEEGKILGHENMGVVIEVGDAVWRVKKGDRVCLPFNIACGQFFTKGLSIGTGQANVKAYNRKLATLIQQGKANPSKIISHELPLEQAPDGYQHFDARDEGWTKVVLKPGK